jgi:N-acetylglutamate synthase-like GNAT family acetyltransferase
MIRAATVNDIETICDLIRALAEYKPSTRLASFLWMIGRRFG